MTNFLDISGLVLLATSFAMTAASAWLKGRAWFIAILVTSGVGLLLLNLGIAAPDNEFERWLGMGGTLLIYAVFCYVIAARHLTRTRVMDITYQSHEAVVRFIDECGDTSFFANTMRRAGPVLLVAMVAFAAVAIWAKSAGKLSG